MTGIKFIYKQFRTSPDRREFFFEYTVVTNEQTFERQESLLFENPIPDGPTSGKILRAMHLALGVSYYKTFLPPEIEHPYAMDEAEAEFWNTVFKNGLGEFLYKNGLKPEQIAKFSAQSGQNIAESTYEPTAWQESALLGIGGGKDSIVAGEILKSMNIPTEGFVLATGSNTGQAETVAETMQVGIQKVQRFLDAQVFEFKKMPGTYHGHVPISLIFALSGCLLASVKGSRYVIVANEASSSIPQVEHAGMSINHQWSKSIEFEKLFQDFVHQNIASELDYFSLIRPLTSLAVAKIFAKLPQYFEVFTSDNSLFKIEQGEREHPRWSKQSSKSLSSFILLAPWMSDEDLGRTFGRNFLDQTELEPLLINLLGAGTPVLDCVGTPEELQTCLGLLHEQGRFSDNVLMRVAINEGLVAENPDQQLQEALELRSNETLPAELRPQIIANFEKLLR